MPDKGVHPRQDKRRAEHKPQRVREERTRVHQEKRRGERQTGGQQPHRRAEEALAEQVGQPDPEASEQGVDEKAKPQPLSQGKDNRPTDRVFPKALPLIIHDEGVKEARRRGRAGQHQLASRNHLGLPEVSHFVLKVRHAFENAIMNQIRCQDRQQAEQEG